MQIHASAPADQYVERLKADQDEAAALFKDLLIGVTSSSATPRPSTPWPGQRPPPALRGPRRRPTRSAFWVPGCATGEEAYTLAILIREQARPAAQPPEVQIFATDIDERRPDVARAGRYPVGSPRTCRPSGYGGSSSRRGQYHVSRRSGRLCLFCAHDLIRDPPFCGST